MKRTFSQAIFLLITTISIAQSNIHINEKAPEINISNWVSNVPDDKDLKGKFVVLEFWATWCGPCIAAVPHMNMLQDEVNHPDLIFVSITDESVIKINRTIDKIDFKSVVVTDTTQQTQINFGDGKDGLEAYPLTVLIDKAGIIKWIGEPHQLNVEILNKLLNNTLDGINHFDTEALKSVSKTSIDQAKTNLSEEKEQSIQQRFLDIVKDKQKIVVIELQETNSTEIHTMKMGNKAILMSPISLKELYNEFFDIQIQSSALVDSAQYSFLYKNSKGDIEHLKEVEKVILNSLGLERQTRLEQTVKYQITINDASLLTPALESLFSSKSEADDKIIFSNYLISQIIDEMSKELNIKLEYVGDNKERFDFILNRSNLDEFRSSLEGYGLVMQKIMEEEQEEVFYIVEKE